MVDSAPAIADTLISKGLRGSSYVGCSGSRVANDPLLGLQVRFPYKNGLLSRISEVYDSNTGTWVEFTYGNRLTIKELSQIEPESFNQTLTSYVVVLRWAA